MPIWRKEHELARVVVHYIGISVTAVAVTSLCGIMSGHPVLYNWGSVGSMSLPTSFCFFLAGIGFYLVSRGEALHGNAG